MGIYTPGTGFAQSTYYDQMATALPGSLAFASDINLVDSATARKNDSETGQGLLAGVGVLIAPIAQAQIQGHRSGLSKEASLPTAGTTAAQFGGILVRNQQMDTNSSGDACWFPGRMVNVLRAERVGGRVGGRIWARLTKGATSLGAAPYWIISDTTGHNLPIGSFSAEAIGADTVQLTNVKIRSEADAANGATIVLLELGLIE